ncbi:alpha/beta hydrolase [Mucilaginibacter polytrichastri]|nr:alpha/beta hydrolase [Mucilaginibacter polytrichastri]SFT11128.1 Acetyl esterase/lipase [Mucilaginibacter polytrichastri]
MKRFFSAAAILFFAVNTHAQLQRRYKDIVFKEVTIDQDLSYAIGKDKKAHLFDLYTPHDDNIKKRPLIIWMHGGGFLFGSKDAKGIKLWSNTFAQRGYVCAAINYSMSKKSPIFGFSTSDLQKSAYYAVLDLKQAIAYFKSNADKYGIDTNKIILGGNSAGGIMALQTAYTNNEQLAEQVGITKSDADAHPTEFIKIAAVVNFWGGIFDLHWLKNTKVPIVSVYGSTDGIINPDHKNSSIYGALAIQRKADELKIPNAAKVFEGYSHELEKHFNPIFSADKDTRERWEQAGQFAADFLYEQLLIEKPKTVKTGTTLDYRTMGLGVESKTSKKKKMPLVTPKSKTMVADTGGTSLDYKTMWNGTEVAQPARKKNK